jgi:hypothetical protein
MNTLGNSQAIPLRIWASTIGNLSARAVSSPKMPRRQRTYRNQESMRAPLEAVPLAIRLRDANGATQIASGWTIRICAPCLERDAVLRQAEADVSPST